MRAIVLDYKEGKAALLLEDGTTAYRRMRCVPGTYVEVPDTDNITRLTGVMRTIAAVLVLVIGLGSYYTDIIMEYSYVSVDVNPSIEFALNRRDRVVKVEALNKDADIIVKRLYSSDINGKTLYQALEITVASLIEEGFMERDEAYMLLDVASRNDERGVKLSRMLEGFLKEKDKDVKVKYAVVSSSLKARDEARKMNLSGGRYEKMMEQYGEAKVTKSAVAEYKVKPVRELLGESGGSDAMLAEKEDQKTAESDKKKEDSKEKKDSKDKKDKSEQKDKDTGKGSEGTGAADSGSGSSVTQDQSSSWSSDSSGSTPVSTPDTSSGGTPQGGTTPSDTSPESTDPGNTQPGPQEPVPDPPQNEDKEPPQDPEPPYTEDTEEDNAEDFDSSEGSFDVDSDTIDEDSDPAEEAVSTVTETEAPPEEPDNSEDGQGGAPSPE